MCQTITPLDALRQIAATPKPKHRRRKNDREKGTK